MFIGECSTRVVRTPTETFAAAAAAAVLWRSMQSTSTQGEKQIELFMDSEQLTERSRAIVRAADFPCVFR